MSMDVEQRAKLIIGRAVKMQASDVHFIPKEKRGILRYRMDGQLYDSEDIPEAMILKMIAHFKFISGMDPGERRRPQSSGLMMSLNGREIDLRLSTFPVSSNETLVIRVFPQAQTHRISQLALFPEQAQALQHLIKQPQGLLLFCGPTGTGKTTSLYSLLHERYALEPANIITLEDPVEQKQSRFLQMEINEKAGVTYASGLRSLLRHDPDIIMIGEIRDQETAEIAVRAALTGHVVFSTLHSKTASGAIKRMNDLGVPYRDLQEVLNGVVAQELVSLICPYCGEDCSLYCRMKRQSRRRAVYEILTASDLQQAIEQIKEQTAYPEKRNHALQGQINKGYALGYIEKSVYRFSAKGGRVY
ncbi:competence type IV pilus ATPase ComGA [Salisediminibacterium halotolerans]|uniref:competence type IV pilus ATPase ComGA n=1 Tax=Salisediminibacterium halotolerans TaxID=517425 RepID=UPI000F1A1688|nr:competence type IV pilus ATPase ComGA [Salisediminibacterium halotolerans]RLJ78098.1 competence-related pilin export protein ComGA [Actinophytocola xinjiangensis]RPE88564.1 competence-related pilin export protein ComGA [Salisediminibacterium halotolerans]TWG37075.1 competence-related pilin export protein ComGA [Salisediminibacterium halotolerans]GEL06930.1 competence protein ComG [Salisediminibacterium halotolerans]